MDIAVTTPRSETYNSRREAATVGYQFEPKQAIHVALEAARPYVVYFRVFSRLPRRLRVRDRIYFVERCLIKGFGRVESWHQLETPIQCTTTERFWGKPGQWVVFYSQWAWLRRPVPMVGFR